MDKHAGQSRITVAGQDRTAELKGSGAVDEEAQPLALELADARNEERYLSELIRQLRTRGAIRPDGFEVPRQPGLAGRLMTPVRRLLWKLFRHQHEAMAFQQNAVNAQVVAALECIRLEYKGRLDAMERRLETLDPAGGPRAGAK